MGMLCMLDNITAQLETHCFSTMGQSSARRIETMMRLPRTVQTIIMEGGGFQDVIMATQILSK